MRKILILAENDGGAGKREGRGGDGDSNEVIGAGGGVLLVIGLGGVLGRADDDDGGGAFLLDGGDVALGISCYLAGNGLGQICSTTISYFGSTVGSDSGSNIMGLLALTVVTQQDITIIADSVSKGIVFNGCIQRASAAVNETNRGRNTMLASPQLVKVQFFTVTICAPLAL